MSSSTDFLLLFEEFLGFDELLNSRGMNYDLLSETDLNNWLVQFNASRGGTVFDRPDIAYLQQELWCFGLFLNEMGGELMSLSAQDRQTWAEAYVRHRDVSGI